MSVAATKERDGMIGPCLPSWLLRLMLAAACAGTVAATTLWTAPSTFAIAVLVAAAMVTVLRPDSPAPTAFLGLVAGTVLFTDPGLSWWTAASVFGVHACHVLAALAAVVPWDASVERSALAPSLFRFAVVQAAGQILVLLAFALTPPP